LDRRYALESNTIASSSSGVDMSKLFELNVNDIGLVATPSMAGVILMLAMR
jgi:hypothetical protein